LLTDLQYLQVPELMVIRYELVELAERAEKQLMTSRG
jgi:hypothetical protein